MCSPENTSSKIGEALAYWESKRAGRRMPARADIEPGEIKPLLPHVILLDVAHDPLDFRYRLIGTRIVTASAEDRTGQFFDEIDFFKNNPSVIEQYNSVVDNAEPHLTLESFLNHSNNLTYKARRLLLPLSNDAAGVDMLMVYFYFTTGPYAKR